MIPTSDPARDCPALLEWIRARSPNDAAQFNKPQWALADFRQMQAIKERILRQENQAKLDEAPSLGEVTAPAAQQPEPANHHELLNHAANVRDHFNTHFRHGQNSVRSVIEEIMSAVSAIVKHCVYWEKVIRDLVDQHNKSEESRDQIINDLTQRIGALEKLARERAQARLMGGKS